jgi:oligoendopeptidase F
MNSKEFELFTSLLLEMLKSGKTETVIKLLEEAGLNNKKDDDN